LFVKDELEAVLRPPLLRPSAVASVYTVNGRGMEPGLPARDPAPAPSYRPRLGVRLPDDGGPVQFKHHDLPYAGVTRPPTVAGSFRVYRGLHEVHSVENLSETPSESLRVEFKTAVLSEATLKGKFLRPLTQPIRSQSQVEFDHPHVRIARLWVLSEQPPSVSPPREWPTLLIALRPAAVVQFESEPHRQLHSGQVTWLGAGTSVGVRAGTDAAEMLRVDFETQPTASRSAQFGL
jgi:hypothetical protein